MRPSVPATVTAGVVALLLTACSGGATGGGGSSSDDTGPLSAYFEKLGGSYDEAKSNAQHTKSEEIIAECMAELGFEYTPTEPWSGSGAANDEDLDWESLEFAEQYGYGYTTGEELFGAPQEVEDPNQERLASMSDAEMEAYNEALWGPPQEVDEEDPEAVSEWDWETAGCYGKGYYAAYEQDDPFSDETVEAAMEEWSKVWEEIPDEPAVRDSLDEWASCMADEGHDFANPNEANSSIGDAYNALYTPAETEFDPEADPDAMPEMPEPDAAAVAELRKKELALAVADRTCQEKSGYAKAQREALRKAEERIWEKYGDQLEAAAAAATPAE